MAAAMDLGPTSAAWMSLGAADAGLCAFCFAHKTHAAPEKGHVRGRYCIMCYVEEDVGICRRCSIPWRATYDANNAYNESRGMGRWEYVRGGDSDVHIICLECVREDFDGEKRLTMSEDDLSEEERQQLHKLRRIVAHEEPLEEVCEELRELQRP
jgi:hypothetical protein